MKHAKKKKGRGQKTDASLGKAITRAHLKKRNQKAPENHDYINVS